MKTTLKIFSIFLIMALAVGFITPKPVSADTVEPVYVLAPSWDATGGGGVFSAYIGPSAYDYVSPGSVAYFDGREAGIIKAGINIDADGHYWDEGLFGFKPNMTIDTFSSGALNFVVETQAGVNPVWMTIEIDTGVVDDRSDNTTYQFIPTTNPAGWHTVDAAAGSWQKWNNSDGDTTGNPLISLGDVALAHTGLNVVRAYLRLGMGDSYNNGGTGTIAWVDSVTIGTTTYDFQLQHPYTWYVSPTGSDSNFGTEASPFLTIQKAIDAAANGDTINVTAGTYVLSSAITVNKDVTLNGVGNPLLQVSGTGERIIMTTAGATLQGFWIEKTDKTGVQNIIYVGANNLTIQNNKVWGQFVIGDGDVSRAMVFTGGLSGLLIDSNEFYGLRQPGYISGVTTGTISNNYTHGTKGWVIEQGNMTFSNNTWGTGANANVYDIAILATVSPAYYTDIPAMSAANNNASIEDQRTSPATLSIVYVDGSVTTSGTGTAASPVKTIAEGITRVVSGGIVHVAAGTYPESVLIQKDVHLLGAGTGTTTISAPGTLPASGDPESFIIRVDGSGVEAEITGFTISGPGPTGCGSIRGGIYVRNNAYANIHDNILADIRDAGATISGCQNGVAILVGRQAWSTSGTATIANNQIIRYQKGGIVVDNTGSNAVITNNTITGIGTTTITAQNGIQISRGATATLSGNTVTGNSFHIDGNTWDWGATGVLLYESGAVTFSGGNTISGNDQGINISGTGPYTFGAETFGPSTAPLGFGYFIVNGSTAPLNLTGATFEGINPGTATNTQLLDIKARIWDGTDEAGMGLVTLKSGYILVTSDGSIQRAIDLSSPGDTVLVGPGTYNEDVNVNKVISLIGAGAGSTTIVGPIGGAGSTITVSASNIIIEGFTITRAGNNLTDWNNAGLNSAGIAIQGQALTGTIIQNNTITHMRTGIDINNSNGHSILNNVITDNRTGMIFRNQTDNMTVTGNDITNNWTVGVLFLDASGGTNSPVQTALNGHFNDNNISGNWYGQVVDRQSGGVLPVPGTTNLKNFIENWWGTTTPWVSSAGSVEPGYSALIPVEFGGTATPPGGQPDILGAASANIIYWPLCADVACSSYIYPPVHNVTKDTYYFTIQAAVAAASSGDTLNLAAGTYPEVGQIIINKNLTIVGANKLTTIIQPTANTGTSGDARGWFLVQPGMTFNLSNVTLDGNGFKVWQGIRHLGSGTIDNVIFTDLQYEPSGGSYAGTAVAAFGGSGANVNITNSGFDNIGRIGVLYFGGGQTGTYDHNTYTGKGNGNWLDYGVEIGGGAQVTITNSSFSDCTGVATVDGSTSAGVLVSTYYGSGSSANINHNTFTNNTTGIAVGYDSADTSSVVAENNKFIGNEFGVTSTNPSVDASPNWWGTANLGSIQAQIDGPVTYAPYWINEPMTILSDTPVSTVYVDDDYAALTDCGTHICGYDAFATIQEGIAAVQSGGTVNVAAGVYTQDLTINKAVTLLGPNATINPNTGSRVAEAVIHPSTSFPDPSVCTNMTYLTTSNITIKGFTFDGDNPANTSGVIIGTADVDACEILAGYEGMGNIVVENNILKNATYAGIDFYNYTSSAATTGNYIRYNLIQNIGGTTYGYGIGALVYNNFYADITNNVFDSVRVGVQTGNFYQANPGTTGSISNNTINAWRLGIFHNLWYSAASPLTISGNDINAISFPGATKWVGILLSSIGGTTTATISNNDITIPGTVSYPAPNYTTGISVWNTTTTAPMTISGGTISGGDYGVWVNNYEGYSSNADNTSIILDGITINGSLAAGVNVWDSPSNTNSSTVTATLNNNIVTGTPLAVQISGSDASATGYHNQISGNTVGLNSNVAGLQNFEANWWGDASGPAGSGNDVIGNVDYTPWCTNPGCTALDAPVINITQGTYFSTIQAAVNAANAGDEIHVVAGTYPEQVTIDKAIDLRGPNYGISAGVTPGTRVAEAVITFPASPTATDPSEEKAVIYANADNISINGFTLDGQGVVDGVGVNAGEDNLTVVNNIVKNFPRVAIWDSSYKFVGGSWDYSYYTSGALIENNLITYDLPGGYIDYMGIYLQGAMGTVRGNVVDNARSSIQVQPYNNPSTTQGLVENNLFKAFRTPMYFNYSENANVNWLFRNNTAEGIAWPSSLTKGVWDGIRVETFYAGNVTFTGNTVVIGASDGTSINLARKVNVTGGLVNGLSPLTNVRDTNTWKVLASDVFTTPAYCGDGDVTCTYLLPGVIRVKNMTQSKGYTTIQAAIDGANPNDVIEISAGTFTENVIVTKSLEIYGAGQTSTFVQPAISSPNCGGGAGGSLCTGSSNVFLVQANNVKIHDLTVDGNNPTLTSGVLSDGVDVDARNGIITNHSLGVFNGLEIYNVTVRNIYLRGIYASSGGSFNIHNNIVTNVNGESQSIALMSFYGTGFFSNNAVSNVNDGIVANWSQGIQFLNNTVTNAGSGIHTDNNGGAGGVGDVISGNTISDCKANGYGIFTFVNYLPITVENNTINRCLVGLSAFASQNTAAVQFTNNTLTAPADDTNGAGIYVSTSMLGYGDSDVHANFTGNTVSGFEYGIYLYDGAGKVIDSDFLHNRITNSTVMQADVSSVGTPTINMEANWWGAKFGPATGTVNVTMDYTRWCGDSACTFLYPVGLGEPMGTKTTWDNTFHFLSIPDAEMYRLEITTADGVTSYVNQFIRIGSEATCNPTDCTLSPTATKILPNGNYRWRMRDWNSTTGYGLWTNYNYFTLNVTYTMQPLTPNTTYTSWNNTFRWNGVPGATMYRLYVTSADGSTTYVSQFFQVGPDVTCSGLTCSVSPSLSKNLPSGNYRWQVRAWITDRYYGAWSDYTYFTLNLPSPKTLIAPVGAQSSWNNVFHFTGSTGATMYRVYISSQDDTTIYVNQFLGVGSEITCVGTDCTFSPTATKSLGNGNYHWKILDYGSYGAGTWTAFSNFSISTAASKVLLSPSGVLTSWDNIFHFTGIPGATMYRVVITTADGLTTYVSQFLGVGSEITCVGTDCTFSPNATRNLPNGDYRWKILDWGASGAGTWTADKYFSINRP